MPPKRASERGTGNQAAPLLIRVDTLDEHISQAEFRTAFTTLAKSVAVHNEWPAVVLANSVDNTSAARI